MGATVSLLVPLLLERGVALDPLEATLAYAGLWEDTGGFSFPSTTPEDPRPQATSSGRGPRSPASGTGSAPASARRPGRSSPSF